MSDEEDVGEDENIAEQLTKMRERVEAAEASRDDALGQVAALESSETERNMAHREGVLQAKGEIFKKVENGEMSIALGRLLVGDMTEPGAIDDVIKTYNAEVFKTSQTYINAKLTGDDSTMRKLTPSMVDGMGKASAGRLDKSVFDSYAATKADDGK